jgi:UDP-glucose 4-epimerase
MNILITGGAGFIGSNLVKNLLKTTNHAVTVIDRDSTNIDYLLNKVTKDLRTFSIINADYVDCCDNYLVNNKIDVVIHLAAIPRVAFSVEQPSSTTLENVYKTVRLLKACHKNVSKFVFASSSSVYGGADILPTPETHPLNPKSPYALQKQIGEQYCKLFSELYGIDTVCLRFFNVFGPEQYVNSPYATVVANWCSAIKNNKPILLDGDGTQSRDFCYVENIVQAIKLVAESEQKFNGEVFNVGNQEQTTLNDIINYLKEKQFKFTIENKPSRLGDVKHTKADITKIKKLGYTPEVDFWTGLENTIKWWNI